MVTLYPVKRQWVHFASQHVFSMYVIKDLTRQRQFFLPFFSSAITALLGRLDKKPLTQVMLDSWWWKITSCLTASIHTSLVLMPALYMSFSSRCRVCWGLRLICSDKSHHWSNTEAIWQTTSSLYSSCSFFSLFLPLMPLIFLLSPKLLCIL